MFHTRNIVVPERYSGFSHAQASREADSLVSELILGRQSWRDVMDKFNSLHFILASPDRHAKPRVDPASVTYVGSGVGSISPSGFAKFDCDQAAKATSKPEPKFVPGDIVVLKGDGVQDMTVLESVFGGTNVKVAWLDADAKLQTAVFPPLALERLDAA